MKYIDVAEMARIICKWRGDWRVPRWIRQRVIDAVIDIGATGDEDAVFRAIVAEHESFNSKWVHLWSRS